MEKRATPRSGNYNGVKVPSKENDSIVSDFERGSRWAGYAIAAMYLLLAIGAVMLGW